MSKGPWRPKEVREAEKADRAIRRERRLRKKAERESRRKARAEKRATREWLASRPVRKYPVPDDRSWRYLRTRPVTIRTPDGHIMRVPNYLADDMEGEKNHE